MAGTDLLPVALTVVDPDAEVAKVMLEHVRSFDDGAVAVEDLGLLPSAPPDHVPVVVMGPSQPAQVVTAQLERFLDRHPGHAAVMVVYELGTDLLHQAMRAGVDDVVTVDSDEGELFHAVERSAERARARIGGEAADVSSRDGAGAGEGAGRVVAVFCAKGGSGKSVIAVNLAAALARAGEGPVVVVDGDVQFGDVALMLQLEPGHTIVDAAQAGDRLDVSMLEDLLLHDPATDLAVLAAPTEPEASDLVRREDLERVVHLLRTHYRWVVVDTMGSLGTLTLAALELADDILAVATLDVLSLRSAKVGLQTLRALGVPPSKVTFVLNRANTDVGLSVRDAEHALAIPVGAALPSELRVAESVNRGRPVVVGSPKSKFARAVTDLAARLMAGRSSAMGVRS